MNEELIKLKKEIESKKLDIQTHLQPFTDEITRLEIELGNQLFLPMKEGFKAFIDTIEPRIIPFLVGLLMESKRVPLQGDAKYTKEFNDAFTALREILQQCNDRLIEPKPVVEALAQPESIPTEETNEQGNQ